MAFHRSQFSGIGGYLGSLQLHRLMEFLANRPRFSLRRVQATGLRCGEAAVRPRSDGSEETSTPPPSKRIKLDHDPTTYRW